MNGPPTTALDKCKAYNETFQKIISELDDTTIVSNNLKPDQSRLFDPGMLIVAAYKII